MTPHDHQGIRRANDTPRQVIGERDPQHVAEESVRQFLADDHLAQALGITASHVAPGEVTAHMRIRPERLNGHGSAHGAALFAVADTAFAMACNSHTHMAIGRSCSIEYLAPAIPGDYITATAVERSAVGRGAIYDVAITRDEDGQLLAEVRAHSRQLQSKPAYLAAELAQRVDVDVIVGCPVEVYPASPERGVRLMDVHDFEQLSALRQHDRVLYWMGNSRFHAHVYELLRRRPGAVLFHDVLITGFYLWYADVKHPRRSPPRARRTHLRDVRASTAARRDGRPGRWHSSGSWLSVST
jgi:acyl-CoA thioesterase